MSKDESFGASIMRAILPLSEGLTWFEIETQEDANAETRLAHSAVYLFFKADAEQRPSSGRYYSLREWMNGEERALATVRIPAKEELRHPAARNSMSPLLVRDLGIVVVGDRNADPYERHGAAISALSAFLGIALPPECYPHRQSNDDEPNQPTP
jgi:hypothetical protein